MRADLSRHADLGAMELPPRPADVMRPVGFINNFRESESIPPDVYGPAMATLLAARTMAPAEYRRACNDSESELRRAFKTLKCAVTEQAVQYLPDPSLPVYIIVDACEHWGHGGSLVQFDRVSGVPRLLQYWSCTWKAVQSVWNAGRKEAYAQYYAATKVLPRYVMNCPAVMLVSDANNLTSVKREGSNLASADPLIRRWAWRMLAYAHYFNFALRTPGPTNFFGDVPSRQSETRVPTDPRAAILAELAAAPTIAVGTSPAAVAVMPPVSVADDDPDAEAAAAASTVPEGHDNHARKRAVWRRARAEISGAVARIMRAAPPSPLPALRRCRRRLPPRRLLRCRATLRRTTS